MPPYKGVRRTMETLIYWCRTIGYAVRQAATGHPTENTLTALALAADKPTSSVQVRRRLDIAQDHVRGCKRCKTALSEIKATLENIHQVAQTASCSIPELAHVRLRQRSEILRRIDIYLAPPATVLAFPSTTSRSLPRLAPLTICLALTCAVGPLLGIVIRPSVTSFQDSLVEINASPQDDFLDDERSTQFIESRFGPYDLATDEAFMAEVEYAVGSPLVSHLIVLDELTPRLHETSVTVR